MPAALPPTPWIRPYDTPQLYLGGVQAGASIAEANARITAEAQRLQQQANMSGMQMQLQQQELAQKGRIEQQQLEIQKAYHQAQIGLQKQKLDTAKQQLDLKVQQATQMQQSQARFAGDVKRLQEEQGMNYDDAVARAISMNPDMFAHGGAAMYGDIMRSKQAAIAEQTRQRAEEGRMDRQEKLLRWQAARTELTGIEKEITPLMKDLADTVAARGKQKVIDELTKKIEEKKQEYKNVLRAYGLISDVPESVESGAPAAAGAPGKPAGGGKTGIVWKDGKLVFDQGEKKGPGTAMAIGKGLLSLGEMEVVPGLVGKALGGPSWFEGGGGVPPIQPKITLPPEMISGQ